MEIIKNITEKSFIVTDYEYSHAGLIDPKMTFYIGFSNSKFFTENIMLEFDKIKLSKEHVEGLTDEKPKYVDSIIFKIQESIFELKISNDLIELFIELEEHLNYFL